MTTRPTHRSDRRLRALDLFAGTGWGVACQRLGIEEYGVEIMPEAIASRAAAGMRTPYYDVWEGLLASPFLAPDSYDLLIASPPCQTFSIAGQGSGRKALNEVLTAIEDGSYRDATRLHDLIGVLDDRTALVLTPLAHVYRDRPTYVVFEQVPTVLPVWGAVAEVMRDELGYSVVTGTLNAEQYGVPQTRKRAFLIARRDGFSATMSTPTHSRFYSHDPRRLDVGVPSWISMADALGFAGFTAEKAMGKGMVQRYGERPGRVADQPAFAIRASAGGMEPGGFVLRSNYGTGGDPARRGVRPVDLPAPTITSKADRNKWNGDRRMTPEEAAALQAYPAGFPFAGANNKKFLQIGNAVPPKLGEAVLRAAVAGSVELRIEEEVAA